MKNIKKFVLLALSLCITLFATSCSEDETSQASINSLRQQYFCIKGLQKDAGTPIVYDVFNRKRIKIDRKAFLKSEYNYFHNQNSIDEATSGISLGLSDEKRNYDLIERE